MTVYPERFADLDQPAWSAFRDCRKKPIIIQAAQIDEPFRVKTLEGDYKQGKPGDYLMCGVEGELYICDKAIFEKSYDWINT